MNYFENSSSLRDCSLLYFYTYICICLLSILEFVSEKAVAPHSSTLAWKIPWTEEPGWLQSMGSLRATEQLHFHISLSCIREGNGNPLQCSCLENPRDGGASRTWLKWLSSSSSRVWACDISGRSLLFLFLKIVTFAMLWCYSTVPFLQTSSSVQFSGSVVSDSLWPRESLHARPPCPSPTPGVYSNSCASSRWCHPAASSSVIPFSSCPQSLPASGSFPVSQLFAWGA